jgi:hypothetical protein
MAARDDPPGLDVVDGVSAPETRGALLVNVWGARAGLLINYLTHSCGVHQAVPRADGHRPAKCAALLRNHDGAGTGDCHPLLPDRLAERPTAFALATDTELLFEGEDV